MSNRRRIVRGRWLLQDADHFVTDGAAVITDGLIERVGSWSEIQAAYPELPVLGSDRHAVMPGLINAHHHSNGVTTLQQGIPDQLLELWLLSLAGRRRAGLYLTTLLSAARLLQSGVTAVVDVHSAHGRPEEVDSGVRKALQAYDKAGLRVAYAVGMTEESFLTHGEDSAFLSGLPDNIRALAKQRLSGPESLAAEDYFAIMEKLHRDYQDHSRIAVWFGPPGPQWVSDDTLVRIADRATAYGVGVQTHLLESVYEKLHGPRAYGRPSLLHLKELGVLSPRLSFAHGVWLTEAEIEVLAGSGAHLSHNPSSNLRLRAGVAPLNALLAAGANVALGMDGTTLNDDEDMFTEMRLAANLHRPPRLGEPAPSVRDIWRLVTTGGARLFQAEKRLGRLAPGYSADLVLLRLDRVTWPWVAPDIDPFLLLLTRPQARDVDTVLIEGQVVLRDGKPTRFDVATTATALAEELARSPLSDSAAHLVQQLTPYLEAHYQQWTFPELEPYAVFNSRR